MTMGLGRLEFTATGLPPGVWNQPQRSSRPPRAPRRTRHTRARTARRRPRRDAAGSARSVKVPLSPQAIRPPLAAFKVAPGQVRRIQEYDARDIAPRSAGRPLVSHHPVEHRPDGHAFALLGSDLLQLDGGDMATAAGQVSQTGVELVLADGCHPPLPLLLREQRWGAVPRVPRDRPSYCPRAVRAPSVPLTVAGSGRAGVVRGPVALRSVPGLRCRRLAERPDPVAVQENHGGQARWPRSATSVPIVRNRFASARLRRSVRHRSLRASARDMMWSTIPSLPVRDPSNSVARVAIRRRADPGESALAEKSAPEARSGSRSCACRCHDRSAGAARTRER